MRFTIDQTVLQMVLDNLAEQPYKTSAPIIAKIREDVKPEKENTENEVK